MDAATQKIARAAYRHVCRATAITFKGDDTLKHAFRAKMRNEYIALSQPIPQQDYLNKISLVEEIAQMLRRNVVQGIPNGAGVFRLKLTKETELGNNEDILRSCKTTGSSTQAPQMSVDPPAPKPSPMKPDEILSEFSPTAPLGSKTWIKQNLNVIKKAAQARKIPVIKEQDLDESFVRGSGPGGQSINKTQNCVQLRHKPTGLRVSCQATRSLAENRKIARQRLLWQLDKLANPGFSRLDVKAAQKAELERRKRKKLKKQDVRRINNLKDAEKNRERMNRQRAIKKAKEVSNTIAKQKEEDWRQTKDSYKKRQ